MPGAKDIQDTKMVNLQLSIGVTRWHLSFDTDFQYILHLVLFPSINFNSAIYLLFMIVYWKMEVILKYTENQYQSPYVCQVNKTAQNPVSGWKPPIYYLCILDIFCTRHPQDPNLASRRNFWGRWGPMVSTFPQIFSDCVPTVGHEQRFSTPAPLKRFATTFFF